MTLGQIRRAARSGRRRVVDYGLAPKPLGTPVDLTGTATYYVDSVAGSNSNDGLTAATPKATLAGVPTLVAGNIVALKCGSVFRENMPMAVSGAAGTPIVWGQYGTGTAPKIKGSKDYGTTLAWTLNSGAIYQAPAAAMPTGNNMVYVDERTPLRKYATLTALQAGAAGGYFADTTNNILYVWMRDSSSPVGHSIEVNGALGTARLVDFGTRAYITVQDIAVMHGANNNSSFFGASTSAGIIAQRCTIGPHYGAGVYVGAPGMIVQDCFVFGSWDGYDYPTTAGAGVGITGGTANSAGAIIRRNWVTGCVHGIRPNAMTSTDIYRNFVYLNHVNGIDVYTGGTAVRVINNTVWHRPDGATPAGHGIDQQAGGTGIYSVNNIVYTDFVGSSTNAEAYTLASGTSANTFEDYNLGWVDLASTGVFGKVNTTTYTSPAAYWAAVQAAYGATNDVHSLNADPLFVSLGDLDPRIRPGSPAINAGMVVSGITDGYSGTAPDLGAFESSWTP